MKRLLAAVFVMATLGATETRAEFLHIDLRIFGMD